MYEKQINKMIERFKEAKNSKGLTDEQISEISGVALSWIKGLFSGEIEHPEFYETMDVANAVGVTPAEIDEIFALNQCECYIGIYWDYGDSDFMTRKDFEDLIEKKLYTREQYCDRKPYTSLEKFDFCPKCGKKIDWNAIRENR